jgi:hypothetical protein
MSLGIVHPPGVSGPIIECPRLYFTDAFLSEPPMWCEVALPALEDAHNWLATMPEWDRYEYHVLLARGYEAVCKDERDYVGWFLWPKGTKITHEFPHHDRGIWVLTGTYFPLTQSTMYEGKWPD